MSVIVSCSGKFHAFALAEQLEKHQKLSHFFTAYAYQKNTLLRKVVKRVDKEKIPVSKISTNFVIAAKIKWLNNAFQSNDSFDEWVASRLHKDSQAKIFIGWSGMSLHSIKRAKELGMVTIVERGSSHIQYQNEILREEYKRFNIDFSIDPRVIDKEVKEYEMADYISIPSTFVRNSFLEYGVSESKLIQNVYGASSYFQPHPKIMDGNSVFRILYVGGITIQKGLVYFFEAIDQLNIPLSNFEVWLIGALTDEMKPTFEKYKRANWKYFGHINHYELAKFMSQCDVAVQPSLQEGLSMVIPQMLASGIPVIASTNTGGEDIIQHGKTGFIVPIRSSTSIKQKIELLYNNPMQLAQMKADVHLFSKESFSWENYGDKYVKFIHSLIRTN
jgi:glycosyltransferase involved in cell wall biosynthesis